MLAAAAALMVGYAIIDANALYADAHDFDGHGGVVADAVDAAAAAAAAAAAGGLTTFLPPFNLVGVRMLAVWFISTGVAAGVTAVRGEFTSHRRWALRHVGAGLWVAAQRPLYAACRVAVVGAGALGLYPDAEGTAALADGFYYASYATTFIYFIAAEWAVRGSDDAAAAEGGTGKTTTGPDDDEIVVS
jgi:hypothetical protein